MFENLIARLGWLGVLLIVVAVVFIARAIIVAWRDTNGNGVIDEDE